MPSDCRKTKTNVITSVNHNRRKQCNGPIRIEAEKCNLRQARENRLNVRTRSRLGLLFDWVIKRIYINWFRACCTIFLKQIMNTLTC